VVIIHVTVFIKEYILNNTQSDLLISAWTLPLEMERKKHHLNSEKHL